MKDTTGSGTDLSAALQEEPSVHLKRDGSVEVLIYHTHTSEAYSQSYTGFYYTDMETRTTNQEQSVVAAGEALKQALEAAGFGVVHDTTVNDTLYNGSYDRSWEVLQKNLEEYPTIQVTIDVHRDSMTTDSGVKYKPTATIDGRKAAQVMLIAGLRRRRRLGGFPPLGGEPAPGPAGAGKLQELYPGLARPLNFSNSKYNMNATPGSYAGGGGHRGEHRQRGRLCRAAGGAGPGPCAGGHCGRRVTLYTIKKGGLLKKLQLGATGRGGGAWCPVCCFLSKPLGGLFEAKCVLGTYSGNLPFVFSIRQPEIYAGFWGTLGPKGALYEAHKAPGLLPGPGHFPVPFHHGGGVCGGGLPGPPPQLWGEPAAPVAAAPPRGALHPGGATCWG